MTRGWHDPLADGVRAVLGEAWNGAEVAIVLGSGLAPASDAVTVREEAHFRDIPGLGPCTVPGHPGVLLRGSLGGVEVLLFRGRRHLYEGLPPGDAAATVRIAGILGVSRVLLCSAVGSVTERLAVGSWVYIDDHVNLMGRNPLEGVRTDAGPAFVDLTGTYRADLYPLLCERLGSRGTQLQRGILAAFPGPTYETPAEVRMARRLGADLVGMSLVPEAVWARFLGLEVLAFGYVTNAAAGRTTDPLDHGDVLRQSVRAAGELDHLLAESLQVLCGAG